MESAIEAWFAAKMAGPFAGRFSRPSIEVLSGTPENRCGEVREGPFVTESWQGLLCDEGKGQPPSYPDTVLPLPSTDAKGLDDDLAWCGASHSGLGNAAQPGSWTNECEEPGQIAHSPSEGARS